MEVDILREPRLVWMFDRMDMLAILVAGACGGSLRIEAIRIAKHCAARARHMQYVQVEIQHDRCPPQHRQLNGR